MDSVREINFDLVYFKEILWFSVNREPVSGIEYTVPNLVDGKEYEFRVAAVNKAGPGEYGNYLYFLIFIFNCLFFS
jgi:hypothetical protein